MAVGKVTNMRRPTRSPQASMLTKRKAAVNSEEANKKAIELVKIETYIIERKALKNLLQHLRATMAVV